MKVIGSLILEESAKAGAGENYESRFLDLRLKVQNRCKTRSRRKISFYYFWSSNKMCKIGAKKGAGDKYQSQFLDLRQKFQNSMVLDVGLSFNSNRCLK